MLLMALNVCWTAAMKQRNLGQGGQTHHLGSCLALCVSEGNIWGRGRRTRRRIRCPRLRLYSRAILWLTLKSLVASPKSLVTLKSVTSSDRWVRREAVRVWALMSWREKQRAETSRSPDLMARGRVFAEGDRGWGTEVQGVSRVA